MTRREHVFEDHALSGFPYRCGLAAGMRGRTGPMVDRTATAALAKRSANSP